MADDFGKEVRELLTFAEEADRENREEAVIDLKFEAGDQWHQDVRNERENLGLPCPTVNVAQQYTGQVVGDWRANESAIKVLPREDGDVKIAEIRSEMIRSVELQSQAPRIYASSLAQMVACGISNFRVDIEDAIENPFLRDLFIRNIPNPLAVSWDPLSYDPTGRDATYCFVDDEMTKEEYLRKYKGAALPKVINSECGALWSNGTTVHVPEYWKIIEKPRTFGMTASGATVDLTDMPKAKWPQLALNAETNEPIIREKVRCKYAVRQMTNGMEALDDPYELKLHRLPIIRVMGREGLNDGKRVRFGLLRFMRDSILMRNHNRAIRAELLMKFPRVNFIGPVSAFEGRSDWDNTLQFNDTATSPPQEVTGRNLSALIAEEQMYAQDLKDVTGIHEASFGMPSNETSGRAIMARQQEGDIATIVYLDNMLAAQQEAGEVINALIPTVFDTARTIRTVGADLATKVLAINDPNNPEAIDLSVGKYDVTISTGPRQETRRREGTDAIMQLIQARPDLAGVIGDLAVTGMDIPNADKIAERIKRTIPPQVLGDDKDDGKSPEEVAQAQQASQVAQQKQDAMEMLSMRKATAEAEKAEAEAHKAKAEAMHIASGRDLDIKAHAAETNRIKAITAKDFPLPPTAVALLAPIVTQAVMNALQSPDILPAEFHADIAIDALDQADAKQAQEMAPPEIPAGNGDEA